MKKRVNQEKYNSDDFLCENRKKEKKGKNGDEKSVLGELAPLYIHFCSRIIF